jgi:glucose 1-dehydrogenase
MTEISVRDNTKHTGKVAVVTGSSKGIGRAIALAFAKSNTYTGIVVNARKRDEAERVAKEVRDIGNCDSIAITADVSQEVDCIRLIDEIVKHYGRIDVLVNNAGIQQEVPFEDTSIEVWQKIISVDLTGPFVCSREAYAKSKTKGGLYNKHLISSPGNPKTPLPSICYFKGRNRNDDQDHGFGVGTR